MPNFLCEDIKKYKLQIVVEKWRTELKDQKNKKVWEAKMGRFVYHYWSTNDTNRDSERATQKNAIDKYTTIGESLAQNKNKNKNVRFSQEQNISFFGIPGHNTC